MDNIAPGTDYEDLLTESVQNKITGDFISTDFRGKTQGINYPAYLLVHNNHVILPHSMEAIMGMLTEAANLEDPIAVYVASDTQGKNLLYLGSGEKYVLDTLLNKITTAMFNGIMDIYVADSSDGGFVRVKKDDLSKFRLHL